MIRRGKQTIYDDDGEEPSRTPIPRIPIQMTHEERQFYGAVTDYVKHVYNRSERLNGSTVDFTMAPFSLREAARLLRRRSVRWDRRALRGRRPPAWRSLLITSAKSEGSYLVLRT